MSARRSWWLAHYNPAESFGPSTLEHLEETADLARAFELGPRALIGLAVENSGDGAQAIAERSLAAATQRLLEAAKADPDMRQLIEAGQNRTLERQSGGDGQ